MSTVDALRFVARIDVYSHNVAFTQVSPPIKELLYRFTLDHLVAYTSVYRPRVGYVKMPKKVFGVSTADRSEFRFHINHYKQIMEFLANCGYKEPVFNIFQHNTAMRERGIEFSIDTDKVPRDYQEETINYFVEPGPIKVTTLQTGAGKTYCLTTALHRIGERTVVCVPGKYVHKWKGDLIDGLGLRGGELVIVRGSGALKDLINGAKANQLEAKVIIISSTTMYNFFKSYKENGIEEYGIHPIDFYPLIRAGIRAIDEAHENMHLNFIHDLYTHVEKVISLSATLDSDDKFNDKMLKVMYPKALRSNTAGYNQYIDVTAINYNIDDPDRFKYMGRNKMYSHVMFEDSIMKSKRRLAAFCEMMHELVDNEFISTYEKGFKCIIFCATIELCTILADYLKPKFGALTVSRYVGEDPDEVLYENELVITTLKSAGTAVDIPGLDVAFLTVALGSMQQNLQALGRLRVHRNCPERSPRYFYLQALNIDKHQEYHTRKLESFKGKVKSHKTLNSNFRL